MRLKLTRLTAITVRELINFFVSPLAYFILAGITFLALYFFIQYLAIFNQYLMQVATSPLLEPREGVSFNLLVQGYYKALCLIFVFFLPAVAMKTFADERVNASFEYLLTSPITTESMVLGKFIGLCLYLTFIVLWLSIMPLSLFIFTELESLVVLANIIGFWLYTLALGSLAFATSAGSNSSIGAVVISIVILLLYYVVGYVADTLSNQGVDWLASLVRYISPIDQIETFLRGGIKLSSLVYFLTVILFGYILAVRLIDLKRVSRI